MHRRSRLSSHRRPPAIHAALLLLIAAMLAGCGNGASPASPPASNSSPAPSTHTSSAPTVVAFDAAGAKAHVDALAVTIGSRPAGSDAERRAAEYLRDAFAAAGYRAELQSFSFAGDSAARLTLGLDALPAQPLTSSIAGTARGHAIFIGLAGAGDIPPGQLNGAVAVADRGQLTFADKARNAAAAGAVALIVVNTDDAPLFGTLGGASTIPVVGVPRSARSALLAAVSAAVEAIVQVEDPRQQTSQNVVATPPNGECAIVIGGHYDSVPAGPGANDNSSGAATTLAIAQARARGGQHDGVCYVEFGAEETGLFGSEHYVSSLSPETRQRLRGMLNLDMVGVGDGPWQLIGSAAMQDIGEPLARALGLAAERSTLPGQFGSDHSSFMAVGIPALFLYRPDDPNYHSANDQARFVLADLLQQAGDFALAFTAALLAEAR